MVSEVRAPMNPVVMLALFAERLVVDALTAVKLLTYAANEKKLAEERLVVDALVVDAVANQALVAKIVDADKLVVLALPVTLSVLR